MAVSYLGQQTASLPQLTFHLFEFITRAMPGGLVTFALEAMIGLLHALQLGPLSELGKVVQISMAYLMGLAASTILGGLYALTLQRWRAAWFARGFFAGLGLLLLALPLAAWGGWGSPGPLTTLLWLAGLSFAWGLALAWSVDQSLASLAPTPEPGRRRFLGQLAIGSLALAGVAIWLGRRFTPVIDEGRQAADLTTPVSPTPAEPTPTVPPADAGFSPVLGTRPEITSIRDFYRVDINLLPPAEDQFSKQQDSVTQRLLAQQGETDIPEDAYVLVVDGLVDNPLALDLGAIRSFPRYDQYATLTCISNPIGGDLIGTTLFSGACLKDILDRVGVQPGALEVRFVCADGYTESLPLESANDPRTLLCYEMGNQPLTREHGAPIRLYTPDRFGMKNPKWIVKIEVIDREYDGYWVVRGWSKDAWVQTASVIDAAETGEAQQVQVGGIAFAGARQILEVEVRVEDGEWVPAEVNRVLSPLTWVLWRANLDLPPGRHRVSVRATDGTGDVQTEVRTPTHPLGATGHHSFTVDV
jgi:DMSO/TMAO reductase YedYZ molybdopterin-dependent catalytic subunit